MNKSVLYDFIEFPHKKMSNLDNELKRLTDDFPYFQTAQILFAKSLKLKDDYRFLKQLRVASLQAFDRSFLRESINKEIKEDLFFENKDYGFKTDPQEISEKQPEEKIKTEAPVFEVRDLLNSENENFEGLFKEKEVDPFKSTHTFSEWLQMHKQTSVDRTLSLSKDIKQTEQKKSELIEKFIQTEPRISKPSKATFFSPQVMAKKSIEENDEIVSETLARIYADQGNVPRAIKVYKKLGLLNPEKNAYFAALIKKLENTELS
jgi:tetratricopeptide (TPR) repeat protein